MVDKFSVSLGGRLRAARRQRGWSLGDVETSTGGEFKASVVGAYERGERSISVQRFVRLSEVYGITAGDLLPLSKTDEELVIDLDALAESDVNGLAERYLSAIRLLRHEGSPDEVRRSDKQIIASLLDLSIESVSGD